MKYCTRCNKQFNITGDFCPQCGNQLTETGDSVFCPNCGKKLSAGARFCDGCGTSLNGEQGVGTGSTAYFINSQNPVQRKKTKYILPVIVFLLVALLAGGGYYYSSRYDKTVSELITEKIAFPEYRNRIVQILPKPLIGFLGIDTSGEQTANNNQDDKTDGMKALMPENINTQNSASATSANQVSAGQYPCVVDGAALLNQTDKTNLLKTFQEVEKKHGIRCAVLSVNSTQPMIIKQYADAVQDKYFANAANGSILMVISMDNQKWHITTDRVMRYIITDDVVIGRLKDAFIGDLKKGNYAVAFSKYAQEVDYLVSYYEKEGKAYRQEKGSSQYIYNITPNAVVNAYHSSADQEGNYLHSALLAVDGNPSTCWSEGVPGLGIGENIVIHFNGTYKVSGMNIWVGHQKSEALFYQNARPRSVRVMGSDGSSEVYFLSDTFGVQRVNFRQPINTSLVKIIVDQVMPGNKYEDTCIAEVSFF